MRFNFRLLSLSKRAVKKFVSTIEMLSAFAQEHKLAEKASELAGSKIEGVAKKEYAAVQKDLAETEQIKMETHLKQKLASITVVKEAAEARLAVIKAAQEELSLLIRLKEAGILPQIDSNGVLILLPVPANTDWQEWIKKTREIAERDESVERKVSQELSKPFDHLDHSGPGL